MNIADLLQHSIFLFCITTFAIVELHNCQLSLQLIDKLKKKYSIKSESSFTDPPTLKHRPVHIQTAFSSSFQRHSQISDNLSFKMLFKRKFTCRIEVHWVREANFD